ncbi:small acid-soluble spore protein K [Bacillus xiapuensis]|uniref:small acid-soluble spore protein K n=1 Tax=Bacillus xiapuensis TaxID=2014075 RepID=UPI000C24348E|nr:small acid-soluble spore protein K [Bacillus xiapuensis]
MRNKAKNLSQDMNVEAGKARAKAQYASKRANGTNQTNPQERMIASNQRESNDT